MSCEDKVSKAFSKDVTAEELESLSKDENVFVRANVASNLKTPINILKILANDNDYLVVSSAIGNPNFPKEYLNNMTRKTSPIQKSNYKIDLDNIL